MAVLKTAHDYFYEKKDNHGHHRFCMLCWPDESEIPLSLPDNDKPGNVWVGCCLNQSSPGNMQRHLRRRHAIETVVEHEENKDEQEHKVDHGLTRDFVYSFVLTDLQPMKIAVKKGVKQFMLKHLSKRVGGKRLMRRYVRDWNLFARQRVKAKLQKAKSEKSRFGLTMDCWKSKGICKQSFAGIGCRWVSASWELTEVCLGIPEMASRKRAVDLKKTAAKEMESMSLVNEDAIAFTTGHEQAQRKGVKSLADICVGCSCHGIQLPPRHVLPPVKLKKAKTAEDSDSSSDSSSSDSERMGGTTLAEAEVAEAAPPEGDVAHRVHLGCI